MAQQLAYLTGNPKLQATRNLSIVDFYYLLISGEYTKTLEGETKWKISDNNRKTTVQSARCGILEKWQNSFWT